MTKLKKFITANWLLLAIISLAAMLRLWRVADYPAGINADEAAYAYNAWSLLETGKDEFGNSWPVHFTSFADYKPGGSTYLMLPFVALFGLTETAVRLPSVLAGTLSVWLIYLLAHRLFGADPKATRPENKSKTAAAGQNSPPERGPSKYRGIWSKFRPFTPGVDSSRLETSPLRPSHYALLTSFLLALSPWHIQFSRGGWETNIATFFLLLGVLLFVEALSRPKLMKLVPLPLAASLYTYHSPRIVIPLLGFMLLVVYFRRLIRRPKYLIAPALIGTLVLLPLAVSFLGPAGSARFEGVSIFTDTGHLWRANRLRGEHAVPGALWVRLLHNRPVNFALEFAQNYLDHFSGNFLFVTGDPLARSHLGGMGQLHFIEIVFVLAGLYYLLKNKPDYWQLPFLWLLAAPAAASLTFQTPNALRAHNLVIPLTLISGYGAGNLLQLIRSRLKSSPGRLVIYGAAGLLLVWGLGYFLFRYFIVYPRLYPSAWEAGFGELVPYLESVKHDYRRIYVTEKYDQPYILFLFYSQYPPEQFQAEAVLTTRDKFGFSTVRDYDRYHFENIDWEKLTGERGVLVVGAPGEIPEGAKIIKEIPYMSGQPAFQIAEL